MEWIILAGVALLVTIAAYAFNEWLDKVEIEKKYLQNMLDEQERNKYTIRKNI